MLLSVQITESTSTQLRISRLYKLVRLAELYEELLGAMTIAEMEKLGYKTERGRDHTSLVQTYLIEQLWLDDNSPTASDRQHQKLSNQISIGIVYKSLQAVFGGGVLLLVPESWTQKRFETCLDKPSGKRNRRG
ncbi:MAG: hypothetical protein M1815_001594 [Lichina confinis]|nr:MAG: hypothetical protein M1815_001594 [Lichina confinis]